MTNKRSFCKLLMIFVLFLALTITILSGSKSSAKVKFKYAKTTVNIRASPNTKSKICGQVYWNDKVKVVKKINKEWYLIEYKNKERYICSKYLKSKKSRYKQYKSPSSSTFKSYEDADCITDKTTISQGRLKRKYHLDCDTGIWMIGNRYCIALGQFYTKKIGTKIDLVLSVKGRKHVLKCIAADCKAKKDTVKNHKIHTDGSIVEFIVNTSSMPSNVRLTGDVSYANKIFKGKIEKIRIYK